MEWGKFKIEEVFNVKGTTTTHPDALIPDGDTPRITTAATNNGLDNFYSNPTTENGKVITIDSATDGYISYQNYDFITTDHVEKIELKEKANISLELGLFFVCVIRNSILDKYSYGYKFSQKRIKRQIIKLPITKDNTPDLSYMEQYIVNIMDKIKIPEIEPIISTPVRLDSLEWKPFSIHSIAESIKSGNDWEAYNRPEGENPFIGASALNNGITDFVDFSTKEKYVGDNVIGVNRNGNVGYAFYHPYRAYFSGDTRFIKLKNFSENKYINLFITTMIMQQKDKYAYGYKMGTKRLTAQKILLPVDSNNRPNWRFMEDYIKSISNSGLI